MTTLFLNSATNGPALRGEYRNGWPAHGPPRRQATKKSTESRSDDVDLKDTKTPGCFVAEVTLPLARIGWHPVPSKPVKMDAGYLFGDETGKADSLRKRSFNCSFTAGVTQDVPHESGSEPEKRGTATLE